MVKISIKTPREIEIMAEGGKRLAEIRNKTAAIIKPGITTADIDKFADELIAKTGGAASFKMVPGYNHATCVNVNEVVVHGIPGSYSVKNKDKVGIDLGLYYDGFHTDTSTTVSLNAGDNPFLDVGRRALKRAIEQARPGKRVADISKAMQETIERAGYSVVTALTGHGIGRSLHEEPPIPCFVLSQREHSPSLVAGMVIAIEVMYNAGKSDVAYKNDDGWTIVTADGKISGLFEQTVAVTKAGPVILTT